MIKRSLDLWQKAKTQIFAHWYLRALCYGIMAAMLLAAWLVLDGDGVAFVYSEF